MEVAKTVRRIEKEDVIRFLRTDLECLIYMKGISHKTVEMNSVHEVSSYSA